MLYFLNTSLTLILALFFILLGGFTFILTFSSSLQANLLDLIRNNFWILFLFGLGFVLIGITLSAYSVLTHRKSYLKTKTGSNLTLISENVIHTYLESYFEKLFPEQRIPFRFLIKKKKMQVIADLPFFPLEEQKNLLNLIESDLSEILSEKIGYTESLELILSFANKKN